MNESSKKPERDELEEARQMQHWVRRYAQNRSLGVVVCLAVFALLCLAIAVPSRIGAAWPIATATRTVGDLHRGACRSQWRRRFIFPFPAGAANSLNK